MNAAFGYEDSHVAQDYEKMYEPSYYPEYEEVYYDDFDPVQPQAQPQRARFEEYVSPLITVVGASGGVGRSTVALLCAWLAAKSGIHTALVEGDLQFGDYGFWLGIDDEQPSLADGEYCQAVFIDENLDLFKAPLFPEAAEAVTDDAALRVQELRNDYDLVIADTGNFWSGLTANLLHDSNLFLMLVDQRVTSLCEAIRASELCARLQIPLMRLVPVYNKWSARSRMSAIDVQRGLDAEEVYCIPDGKGDVEELISSGHIDELIENENAAVKGVRGLLEGVLPRVGHLYSDVQVSRVEKMFR